MVGVFPEKIEIAAPECYFYCSPLRVLFMIPPPRVISKPFEYHLTAGNPPRASIVDDIIVRGSVLQVLPIFVTRKWDF
jgi:hypothetical protein